MRNSRLLSLAELLLGAFIVVAHNVYHILPNEVPILFVLGMFSSRLREGSFCAFGFRRPSSWLRTIGIALAAAALRLILSDVLLEPITSHFWPPAIAPSGIKEIEMNWQAALKWLGIAWTFAAVGEEFSYRGYLFQRACDIFGDTKSADVAALIITSILFGYGHFYKGPSGMIDSGFAGLLLGMAYLLNRKNLWGNVLAHGVIDSVGVVTLFFGWQ
jgi:membrane protease YdiL (CAAX protease family)